MNILKPEAMDSRDFILGCVPVSSEIGDLVARYQGSISAEHGVGLLKKDDLHYSRSATEIDMIRRIKKAFDPKGLLNPGKVFDA